MVLDDELYKTIIMILKKLIYIVEDMTIQWFYEDFLIFLSPKLKQENRKEWLDYIQLMVSTLRYERNITSP